MPKLASYPIQVTWRLRSAQADTRQSLAQATGRTPIEIVRWLIHKATLQDLPPGWLQAAEAEKALRGRSEHRAYQRHGFGQSG